MQSLRHLALLACALVCGMPLWADDDSRHQAPNRPRVVVGMVVDQMSWDYLYRFNDRFVNGGFRRLLSEGFNCQNTRISHIPSVTAIGHATIYTGSVPSIHGIAGNNFQIDGKPIYCTEDKSVESVGAPNGPNGQMSPRNMLTTSITDELKLATNFSSRVYGVSIKDRGAILPAGHSADAAYWFDDVSGNFISSTYYMKELPRWAKRFNERRLPEKYLSSDWQTLHHSSTYKASVPDANAYEEPWGDVPATLPLPLKRLSREHGFGVLRTTPWGNTVTLDMAMALIDGERLGSRRDSTDFLAISLSSTDYIGHRYNGLSVELEDTYLRLDRDLERFFGELDKRFGKDGYLFFITADHAIAHNTTFLKERKLPGRVWRTDIAKRTADSVTHALLGTNESVITAISNYQIFLDEDKLTKLNADRPKLMQALCKELSKQPGVAYVVEAAQVAQAAIPEEIRYRIINGYNQHRSGAIFVILHPGWQSGRSDKPQLGTNHAVWAPYDTHIPLIFMGHGIKPGYLYREVHMTDIAPTLAFLLKTQLPSGAIGKPITELFD